MSNAEELLAELAARPHCVYIDGREYRVTLGTLATPVFDALSGVLAIVAQLGEEGSRPVTTRVEVHGREVPWPPDVHYRKAQLEAATAIETAIRKALES